MRQLPRLCCHCLRGLGLKPVEHLSNGKPCLGVRSQCRDEADPQFDIGGQDQDVVDRGRTDAEITEQLQLSERTVHRVLDRMRKRVSRGLERLRAQDGEIT